MPPLAAALYGTCPQKEKLAVFTPRRQETTLIKKHNPPGPFGHCPTLEKDLVVRLFDTITNADFAELYRLVQP